MVVSLTVNISKLAEQKTTQLGPTTVLLKIRFMSKDQPHRSIFRGDIAKLRYRTNLVRNEER